MTSHPVEEQGTHFWRISLVTSAAPGSFAASHVTGTVTPDSGATRYGLFESLLAKVREWHPELQDSVVISFDIQPNRMDASGSRRSWWRRS